MKWLRRRRPRPPQGVQVVYYDGTRIPCEVNYVGVEDGAHVWETTALVDVDQVDGLHIDVMPGNTSLRLLLEEESGPPPV